MNSRIFKFTTYNNVRDRRPAALVDESILVDTIRDRQSLMQQTAIIRAALTARAVRAADKAKRDLPGFTPHALFEGPRQIGKMQGYTGLAFIDVDHIAPEEVEPAFSRITALSCTRMAWRSVSGLGIHILVELAPLSGTPEDRAQIFGPRWTEAYVQACQFYAREAGIEADPACKDQARFCFVNHDPQIYYNPDALPLAIYFEAAAAAENADVETTEKDHDFGDRNDVTGLNDSAYLAAYREAYNEVRALEAERLRKRRKPLERDLDAWAAVFWTYISVS
jgi:hypothetical protein